MLGIIVQLRQLPAESLGRNRPGLNFARLREIRERIRYMYS